MTGHLATRLSVFLWIGLAMGPAMADDWTRFRGPNGLGVSETASIPAQWTTDDYTWRVKLPGVGHSSPVVLASRILVTSTLEEDATQIVRCLRTGDGGLIWKRDFPSATHTQHDFNCYASSTPAVDADHVYHVSVTPDHFTVTALDLKKGHTVWQRDLGPFVAEHGFGASGMLYEGLLILPDEQDGTSSVIALDRMTGKTRWNVPRRTQKTAYATPCIYQPQGKVPQLIVNSWAHGFSSLDPRTGETLWELPILNHRVVASPGLAAGLIFTSCGSGGSGKQMFAVRPGDPELGTEPEVAYEISGSLPYVCTPVAKGDLIFLWYDLGVVTCLDAPSGRIHWRERVGGEYFCSPVRAGNRLYCISKEGEMVVLAAESQFKELGRIDLEEPTFATPAIAAGTMYLRTTGHLMALESQ